MPQLLGYARSNRAPGILAPGSPVRYYIPVAPPAFGATTVALVRSWRSHGDRRMIKVTAASLASATALSAYLIRSLNVRLLTSDEPLSEGDLRRMVAIWHMTNAVRLGALAVAFASLSHVTSERPDAA